MGVGVGAVLFAWDEAGDGDGALEGTADAAGADAIMEGGELLWRRDLGLPVNHLAGHRRYGKDGGGGGGGGRGYLTMEVVAG